MLLLIGWLLLAGVLLKNGNTVMGNIVLWGGLILIVLCGVSVCKESARASANRRRYWAHYYDKDQVEARRRNGQRRPPVPHHDEVEDYIFFDSIFDDE